jgi:hypothetical protein
LETAEVLKDKIVKLPTDKFPVNCNKWKCKTIIKRIDR